MNSAGHIYKNMRWQSQCVQLILNRNTTGLAVDVHTSKPLPHQKIEDFKALCQHLAGLKQDTAHFAEQYQQHPQFAPVVQQHPHLFIAQATPFEAVCWAIIGQLISVAAAISIRRRLILAAGHEFRGLHSFPDHHSLLHLGVDGLRGLGLPQRKAQALYSLAKQLHTQPNFLPSPQHSLSADALSQRLQSISGIGPWTAQYTLLRGYNHLAADLSGDVAVRRALGHLLASERPSASETKKWLQQFAPYQALAAAHLWQWEQNSSL